MSEATGDGLSLPVRPKPDEHSNPNPFDGIDYFKKFDDQKVDVVETGTLDTDSWVRAEYYPVRGCYRIQYIGDKGKIRAWEHNLRRPLIDTAGVFADEKSVKSIKKGKERRY